MKPEEMAERLERLRVEAVELLSAAPNGYGQGRRGVLLTLSLRSIVRSANYALEQMRDLDEPAFASDDSADHRL